MFASLLTHANVDSLTLYEAIGPRGIVDSRGCEFPMTPLIGFVLSSYLTFRGLSSLPLQLVAFGVQLVDETQHVVLGNLSGEDIVVQFFSRNGYARIVTVSAESVLIQSVQEEPKDA